MNELEEVKTKKTVIVNLSRKMIDAYLRCNGWLMQPGGKFVHRQTGAEILPTCSAQMALDEIAQVEKRDSYLIFKEISLT